MAILEALAQKWPDNLPCVQIEILGAVQKTDQCALEVPKTKFQEMNSTIRASRSNQEEPLIVSMSPHFRIGGGVPNLQNTLLKQEISKDLAVRDVMLQLLSKCMSMHYHHLQKKQMKSPKKDGMDLKD